MHDAELLNAYAADRSQSAFAELVKRYIGLVYSAARRQTKQADAADDVTQAVFIVLAQKAGRIDRQTPLSAWLLKTTHFASMNFRKRHNRRVRHEQAAAALAAQRELAMSDERFQTSENQQGLSEELDAALAMLSDRDRGAVTLRYLSGLSVNDTAAALSVTPAAAGKRIARALDRLRRCLRRRGVSMPSAALGPAMMHLPAFTPRVHLAGAVTAAARIPAAGLPAALAKGAVHMMNWIKIKIAAAMLGAAALAGIAATGTLVILQHPIKAQAQPAPALLAAAGPNDIPAPPPAPASVGFVGKLANGISIEVVGVSESPSEGKKWWKADGSPLAKRPYRQFWARLQDTGELNREVAIRVNHTLAQGDTAELRWNMPDSSNMISSDVVGADPGIEAQAFSIVDNADGFRIHASVAAGRWTTVETFQGIGGESRSRAGLFGLAMQSFLCSSAMSDHGKTRIMVGCSMLGTPDVRMVAVDQSGGEHPAKTLSGVSDGSMMMTQFESELPVESIKEWQFQTRPYDQWIEIRHVALQPGKHSDVQIVTSDNP